MEQYKSRDGKLIYEGTGVLEIVDEKNGIGKYELAQTNSSQYDIGASKKVTVWVVWSAILVKVE